MSFGVSFPKAITRKKCSAGANSSLLIVCTVQFKSAVEGEGTAIADSEAQSILKLLEVSVFRLLLVSAISLSVAAPSWAAAPKNQLNVAKTDQGTLLITDSTKNNRSVKLETSEDSKYVRISQCDRGGNNCVGLGEGSSVYKMSDLIKRSDRLSLRAGATGTVEALVIVATAVVSFYGSALGGSLAASTGIASNFSILGWTVIPASIEAGIVTFIKGINPFHLNKRAHVVGAAGGNARDIQKIQNHQITVEQTTDLLKRGLKGLEIENEKPF